MKGKKGYALLICLVQILGVLGWNVFAVVYHHYTKQYITPKPSLIFIIIISPPLVSAALSLVLSFLLPIEANFKKAILLSIPATIVYFGFYVLEPYLLHLEIILSEAMAVVCAVYIPITMSVLLTNSLAVWLGSLIHARLIKQKVEPTG